MVHRTERMIPVGAQAFNGRFGADPQADRGERQRRHLAREPDERDKAEGATQASHRISLAQLDVGSEEPVESQDLE
jgi:hypothetical protein